MKLRRPRLKLPKLKLPVFAVERPLMMWFIGGLSVILGLEFAYFYGALQYIYDSDITKLTVAIAFIFCWQSLACGYQLSDQLSLRRCRKKGLNTVERGWLWSDVVLSLGMIGTVVGFMVMLSGFAEVDFSDTESTQGLIAQLSFGMSTALSTTLVGLIASVILKLQFFMLEAIVRRDDETDLPF